MKTWIAGGMIAVLLAFVPAGTPALAAADKAGAAAALSRADAAAKVATSLDDQWAPTAAALKAAHAAQKKGDNAGAIKLADRAYRLATLSIRQAREQQKLWPNAVVR